MMNRQKFAMFLGILIVISHIGISVFLWFVFDYGREDGIFLKEISLPLTLGYSIAIVKWFLDNDGIISDSREMGYPLVILISIISLAFIGGLVIAPILFYVDRSISVSQLNNLYLAIESLFGGMFSLIFSYLFGSNDTGSKREANVPVSPPSS